MENKKLAAAVAAVFTYIKTQEEAAAMAAAPAAQAVDPAAMAAPVVLPRQNLWGQSGRQAHMQLRTMMQMRAFK
ncbi:MAG: hypothetical protein D3926_18860 [Desulfobacteraceae bacterium]|nr:MAG: hypothetical protein D3926_18860 [Desulfobacteraceae bacterium]